MKHLLERTPERERLGGAGITVPYGQTRGTDGRLSGPKSAESRDTTR
jgi:hypothetical protein